MAQVARSPKVYDVCIIGSGASGGTARRFDGRRLERCDAGSRRADQSGAGFQRAVWPTTSHVAREWEAKPGQLWRVLAPNGSWDIEGEPYTTAPGSKFRWFRSRIVGAAKRHWDASCGFAPVF